VCLLFCCCRVQHSQAAVQLPSPQGKRSRHSAAQCTASGCIATVHTHPHPYLVANLKPWQRQSAHCATYLVTLSQAHAANQTVPCKPSSKAAWARRATDPAHHSSSVLDAADLPEPSVYLQPCNGTCNSYLPDTNGLGRLLWTVKYLVANGMYVVVSLVPKRDFMPHPAPLPNLACHTPSLSLP
jgi:hypothetical protein